MSGATVAAQGDAAALVVDGRLEDFLFDAPAAHPPPEAVVQAVVDRTAAALGAAFAQLPGGGRGWLRARPGLKPGATVLAQVSRWADPGKAAPLTEAPALKGRWAMLTPGAPGINVSRALRDGGVRAQLEAAARGAMAGAPEGAGLVVRTAAGDADPDALADEIARLREAWETALAGAAGREPALLLDAPDAAFRGWRDWPEAAWVEGEDAFERCGVWDMVEAARGRREALPNGAWMSVEATAALTAVDVNTGEDFSKTAAQAANLAACAALPRALRVRGLGGLVYLDLAPIKKGARQGVDAALKRAFGSDPVETRAVGWTPAGAVELQRRRERRPLRAYPHG